MEKKQTIRNLKVCQNFYTGNANERVLVVLLSDRMERLPEYATGSEKVIRPETGPDDEKLVSPPPSQFW